MLETIIKRLLEEQSRVAHETMEQPGDGSSFEYGRRAGRYAGLGRAIAIIEETLAQGEDDEHDRKRRTRSTYG
ncbi:hypothetical protein UFOVP122_31 [uncultured Caudovirales phage]|uniref:Uncharacterized protein n=1 Tax=uncultured Caudovirales phage TaxID=2100421 RepID=A0A6J5LCG1_9CAUD|nr:hypothetical protein UFOVP122_31 [uncultured Caudovirales phage]